MILSQCGIWQWRSAALGQQRPWQLRFAMSAFTQEQPNRCIALSDAKGHKPTKCVAAISELFDHLVGGRKQR
jgi:hypothetical protein